MPAWAQAIWNFLKPDIALWVQTVVLTITAVIVLWYAWETRKLAKEAADSNTLHAVAVIGDRFTGETTQKNLRFLTSTDFWDLGFNRMKEFRDKYRNTPEKKKNRLILLEEFTSDLRTTTLREYGTNCLDAIEGMLTDIEMIAIPLSLHVKAAEKLAESYRSLIERTSESLLLFVEIERELRDDPKYRKAYVDMLKWLGIDTKGLDSERW